MSLFTRVLAAALALFALLAAARADDLRESYVARLSEKDHFNSSGTRLDSAAAIIRQDRANFHRYGIRDPEDQSDDFFANARNRELMEKYLERGTTDHAALQAILNSTPLIRVEIYKSARTGNDYIVVNLAGRQ